MYFIKLILILVFNICVNIYYINSECKCCGWNSKSGGTGSESKGNLSINPPKGIKPPNVKTPVNAKHKLNNYHNPLLDTNSLLDPNLLNVAPLGIKHKKQEIRENNKKGENNTNNVINSNDNKNSKNENNKTEPENTQQEEVIDGDDLTSVVFTLSENNGGIIKINDSDKQYIKADFDAKNIVNPLFEKRVCVYKINNKLYDSIKEDSKIVFTYENENNTDEPKYIFCAVKLKDERCFLIVCTDGNTICDEKKCKGGLFDANNHLVKNSYYDFLSEEFKMISCGKGICNISSMFYRNTDLKKIIFLEGFNTGNVADMSFMFANCSSLTNLNLSKFNTGKVVNIEYMFGGCNNLEELDLSSFDEANSLEELNEMFKGCPIEIEVLTSNNEIKQEMNDRINRLIKIREQEQEQQNQEQNNKNQ